MKHAQTWQGPLKHSVLAPAWKERKTNRDIFSKLKKYNLFHCLKYSPKTRLPLLLAQK